MSLPLPPGQTPRQWQVEAVDAARAGLAQYQAVIISAATGCGKGSVIAGVACQAARNGHRVLLLAHRDELVQELVDRIERIHGAPKVGLVKASRDEWLCPIVVASVQSITARRMPRMGRFQLVLTDECHHAPAPGYRRVYDAVGEREPGWKHIGFTATPFRSGKDGGTSGLGSVFGAVVYEWGIADAIRAGDLVPLRAFQVSTSVDLSGVKMLAGDFDEDELAKAVDTPERNELVVDQYVERGRGRPALVFGASIAHAQHMAEAFRSRGIRAEAVWGDMGDDRRRLVAEFKRADGSLPVLCSKDLIFEGFDAPATELVLKARPTKSRVVFTQMVGRGLRLSPGTGKAECIFVDLVDNGVELDLATAQDLSEQAAEEAQADRELQVGDRVERRHHRDWGVGRVIEVVAGALSHARVQWPPSGVHRHGVTLTHTEAELRVVPKGKQLEVEQLVLTPRALSVRAYEVHLLPGADRRSAVGWYEYQGAYSVAAELPDGGSLGVLVRARVQAWEVWQRRRERPSPRDPSPEGTTTRVHVTTQGASREQALAWAEEHLRSLRARVALPDHAWKGEALTESQARTLRSWGIRRDTSGMSRGEASALIDAVIIAREIVKAESPGKARRAEIWRSRYARQAGGAA